MKNIDLLSLYMEMEFGLSGCNWLKRLVNEAIDKGEWIDGFEIAVKKGDLDYYECAELYETVKKAYPQVVLNVDALKTQIDQFLPQAYFASISWLVAENGSLIITDSLRVGKFVGDSFEWVTKRISWDGIKLIRVVDGIIEGEWYSPVNSQNEWQIFRLSIDSGVLLQGEEIEF